MNSCRCGCFDLRFPMGCAARSRLCGAANLAVWQSGKTLCSSASMQLPVRRGMCTTKHRLSPHLFAGVAAVPHLALRPAVCRLPAAGGLWRGGLFLKPLPAARCQASLASPHCLGWCFARYQLLAASGEVRLIASALLYAMATLRPAVAYRRPPACQPSLSADCRHSALPFALPHRLPFAS